MWCTAVILNQNFKAWRSGLKIEGSLACSCLFIQSPTVKYIQHVFEEDGFSKIAHSSYYHPRPVALKQSNLAGTPGDMDKQEASATSILCLKKDDAKHPSMHSALSRRQSGRPKRKKLVTIAFYLLLPPK